MRLVDNSVTQFVGKVTRRRPEVPPEVALFAFIRDLAYATDGAHDMMTLISLGRGDCLAKAELLHWAFH
ncbi:MAG: hypothetical protein ACRD1T_13555 [Acidimicrobiia bacterium]